MNWLKSIFRVWRKECHLVFTDIGVLLFFIGLPLGYPIVYTLIYNPEVVTDITTVVVDNSRTAESRELARTIDATQGIKIVGYATDMAEAREAMHEKKCYGVVEIPHDYAKRIGRGEPTTMSFYCDMSLLLRYRQYLFSLTDVRMAETMEITAQRLSVGGLLTTSVSGLPVNSESFFLGDPTQGFASFVMPGIVVLILHQSLLLGITMIAGTASDRRRRNHGQDPYKYEGGATAVVLGKTLCYMMIYLPISYYILGIIPHIFSLPHAGQFLDYMPMIFVMLLATSFFGQTLQVFVKERETALLVIVFTSVVFLFLSGLTWPRYAFNQFWLLVSDLIPATWGMESFIRMNGNGATLADLSGYYLWLWGLAALYFITAVTLRRFHAKAAAATGQKDSQSQNIPN